MVANAEPKGNEQAEKRKEDCKEVDADATRLQWLPCRIAYDGEAKVQEYFESSRTVLDSSSSSTGLESAGVAESAEKPSSSSSSAAAAGVQEAFLRGRKLKGRYVSLEEEGYQCAVMEKSGDGQCWKATENFDGFTQWNHSTLPEPQRALEILTLANSLC